MKKRLLIFSLILSLLIITGCSKENKYNITFYKGTEVYQIVESTGEIKFPGNPSKPGYEFIGWYFDETFNKVAEGTISQNTSIYAKFNILSYSINYELNGGSNDSSNPSSYSIESTDLTLKPAYKKGYNFTGWYLNNNKIDSIDKTLLKDITLVAKYSEEEFGITYNLDGGINNELNIETYKVSDENFELLEPTKKGYKFLGWFDELNNEVNIIDTSLCTNIKLIAKWQLETYLITYNTNGGFNSSLNPNSYDVTNLITFAECTKTGYDFTGWVDEEGNIVTSTLDLTGNITLTATFKIAYYTVTFVDPQGEVLSTVENVEYNTRLNSLPEFDYEDNLAIEYYHIYRGVWTTFNYRLDKIEGNTTVYLNIYNKQDSFTNQEEMLISYTGNSSIIYIPWIINGTEINAIGLDVFNSKQIEKVYIPNNITNLNARCFKDCGLDEIIGLEHIEFIGPSALSGNNLEEIKLGKSINTVSEFSFSNNPNLKTIIIENESPFEFDSAAFDNEYIIYVPNNTYQAYLENDEFKEIEEHIYEFGKIKVTYYYLDTYKKELVSNSLKFNPTGFDITGYDIDSYYLDDEYNSEYVSKINTEDLNLYCKLSYHNYNINYNLNGGRFNEEVTLTFTINDELTLPTPVKDGYIFIGWFKNEDLSGTSCLNISQNTTEDITIYAKYIVDEENEYINVTIIDIDGTSIYEVKPVIKDMNINDVYFDLYNNYIVEFYTKDESNAYTLFTGNITEELTLYVNYYTEGFTITAGVVSKYFGTDLENVVIPWMYKGTIVETLGAGSYTSILMDSNTRESIDVTSIYIPRTIKIINDYALYCTSPKMEIYMLGARPKVGNNFVTLYPTTFIYVNDSYYEDYKTSFIGSSSYYDYRTYILKHNEFVVIFADYFEQSTGMVRSEFSRVVSNEPVIVDKIADPTVSDAVFDGWYLDVALTRKYDFETELSENTILYPKFIKEITINLYDYKTGSLINSGKVLSNEILNQELLRNILSDKYIENVIYETYTRGSYDYSLGTYSYTYIDFNQEIGFLANTNTYISLYITNYDSGLVIENNKVIDYSGNSVTLTIPEKVKNIMVTVVGSYAFSNNETLLEITLPASILAIEDYAFSGCHKLETLNILTETAPNIGSNVFGDNTSIKIIPLVNNGYDSSSWEEYKDLVVNSVSVTFVYNENIYEELIIISGTKVSSPVVNPENTTSSKFGGWYQDEECTIEFDFENTIISADTTIYGKYISSLGLSINLNDSYLAYVNVFAEDLITTELFTDYLEQLTPTDEQVRTITLTYINNLNEEKTIDVVLGETFIPADYKYGTIYFVIA